MADARIAVTGLGCVLPGASSADELWALLASGQGAFVPLPTERFDAVALAPDLPRSLAAAPLGAIVPNFELDARRMRLPPLQLQLLHRMEKAALAAMIQALEDAGIERGDELGERTRVFIGASTLGPDPAIDQRPRIYRYELSRPIADELLQMMPARADALRSLVEDAFDRAAPPVIPDSLATSASLIAGRIGNLFDFQGGHIAVDAAAASSMAALAMAMQSLRAGECDCAVVCGISPLVGASRVLSLVHAGWLGGSAPRPFTADAQGTVPGEGSVALVLRRADNVGARAPHALIEAIASATFDGTDPSRRAAAVAAAVRAALAEARVPAGAVDFIASRAAGIAEIDAAERDGLAAYGGPGEQAPRVASVASAVGDLDGAGGIAAVVAGCICLSRRQWPGGTQVPWSGPRRVAVSDALAQTVIYQAILATPEGADAALETRPGRTLADEGVAIVGVGAVVPGADSAQRFWENILAGVDAIQDIPQDRWDVERLVGGNAELAALLETRHAGVVNFGPVMERARELARQREGGKDEGQPENALAVVAGELALEDAGWTPDRWAADRVCVVLGQLPIRPWESQTERRILFHAQLQRAVGLLRNEGIDETTLLALSRGAVARHTAVGTAPLRLDPAVFTGFSAASDLARTFGFTGGALSVDAACASSLAAVKVAADALLRGESDVALAGGIACNLLPEYYVGLGMLGVLSKQGARPFHVAADGFIPAEGAGVLVLKRLSDARRDGDRVYAVLRGMGVASDGAGLSVYAPQSEGEQRAMRRALADAGIDPGQIDLVEAHGVGTQVGDEAEIESYRTVYGARSPASPLSIGTTKAQVGHLSSAAAALSMIKTAYALRECVLPPGDLGQEGDAVRLPEESLRLLREPREWTTSLYRRRRAAVSAIGLGGISYHAILEEPDASLKGRGLRQPMRPRDATSADRVVPELANVSLPAGRALSLAGRPLLIVAAATGPARDLCGFLSQHCDTLVVVEPGGATREAIAATDGVIDLSAYLPGTRERLPQPAAVLNAVETTFATLRAAYDRLTDGGGPRFYAAVVSLGGDLGSSGRPANVLGARYLGLGRALKREIPALRCRILDAAATLTPGQVAGALVAELESDDAEVTVAYDTLGRRFVPRHVLALPAGQTAASPTLPEGQRYFFAGGGRGILFQCALALRRLGAKVVVSGRTALPDPALPWLQLGDKAFETYKRDEMLRCWQQERMPPVQFQAAFGEKERQRELHRNLALARRLGIALDYEVCDVTDAAQVRRAVDSARERWGGIDIVVHGAMVEQSVAVPGKTARLVAATFAAKAVGLIHLLEATRADGPRFVCFGSVAGVLGNAGQTDYAAADTLMSAILRAESPPSRDSVTINWPGWRGTGHLAESHDLEARVGLAGITTIRPDEGVHWFINEVAYGDAPQVAVVGDRMLQRWAWNVATPMRPELDDAGRPIHAGAWPMVDAVGFPEKNEARTVRVIDRHTDLYLDQHRVNGVPTLPFAFGCEMIAEAAELTCPGMRVALLLDVSVDTPVKLFLDEACELRTHIRILSRAGQRCLVEARITSDLRVRDQVSRDARVHFTARAMLEPGAGVQAAPASGDSGPTDAANVDSVEPGGYVHSRSFYHLMREPLLLGAAFDRAAWLRLSPGGVSGTVQPRRNNGLLRRSSSPRFVVDPFVLDSSFQIAASWDGFREGWICVPTRIARIQLLRAVNPGEAAHVRATVTAVGNPEVSYSIRATGDDGAPLFLVHGLVLRRFARKAGGTAAPTGADDSPVTR